MSAGDWKDLYQAAVDGDLALVQHHISEGVDPNYQHPEILRTPLVASLVEGHLEVARYLLAHGADPSLVSELDNLAPSRRPGSMAAMSSSRYCAALARKSVASHSGGAGFPFDLTARPRILIFHPSKPCLLPPQPGPLAFSTAASVA